MPPVLRLVIVKACKSAINMLAASFLPHWLFNEILYSQVVLYFLVMEDYSQDTNSYVLWSSTYFILHNCLTSVALKGT